MRRFERHRKIGLIVITLLFVWPFWVGCASTGWQEVKPHYDSQRFPTRLELTFTSPDLRGTWSSADGTQDWVVGDGGTILRYSTQLRRWEKQESGTDVPLRSIFGTSDGSDLWATGSLGTILHYSAQLGHWESQDSGTRTDFYSIFGSSDGSHLWVAGAEGTILHYSKRLGRWERQESGNDGALHSIFGSSDGSNIWAAGRFRTILHYSKQLGRWEEQESGSDSKPYSIFGSSDGSQVWAAGGGTILHYSAQLGRWEQQERGAEVITSIFVSSDGSQVWAAGYSGAILHYSTQLGRWEKQESGTEVTLNSIFGSSDGSQVWAAGDDETILNYSAQLGRWKKLVSGTRAHLSSVFGISDGSQVWATGNGEILLYSTQLGRWEKQETGTRAYFTTVFGSSDGSQVWAAGNRGAIVHYSTQLGRWETQEQEGVTKTALHSIFGSSDGSQVWATGDDGTLLHYSTQMKLWETERLPGQSFFGRVFGTSDGSRLWAIGNGGQIVHGTARGAPYVSAVRLVPGLSGVELEVRTVSERVGSAPPLHLTLLGSRKHSFENGYRLERVSSVPQPLSGNPNTWVFRFNPTEIDVEPGAEAHLRIALEQGAYKTHFDVDLTYDRYHYVREHWRAVLALTCVACTLATLTLLLYIHPLSILNAYSALKIYKLVEQIRVPVVGESLRLVLQLTVLPWFVMHPRTLRAWVNANVARAAAAWATSVQAPEGTQEELAERIPYVPLPVQVKDVTSRTFNRPSCLDFESMFRTRRSVVQIVGPGGGGKTTLAKHIGDLALAGGRPGGFKDCRLPIWVDEDFSDLRAVLKRKINAWYDSGENLEDPFLDALLEKGLLLIIVDRLSERLSTTQGCIAKVHGAVRLGALLITTRQPIVMEVREQRFLYPQALDSSTLLNFMTEIIKYSFRDSDNSDERPLSTLQSQLELGRRLADLIVIKIRTSNATNEIPMLPLPVVLFVSDAVALVKEGHSLDELPKSLPDVYANYLRRINPQIPGLRDVMGDEEMLRAAKALAELSLRPNYIPKEFTRERGLEHLRTELPDLPAGVDPIRRLIDNGALRLRTVGATTLLRFALDPVAEFLAAEVIFDRSEGDRESVAKLLRESLNIPGFHNALLLTAQARGSTRAFTAEI
jgi:hypothetical protein